MYGSEKVKILFFGHDGPGKMGPQIRSSFIIKWPIIPAYFVTSGSYMQDLSYKSYFI